MLQRRRSAPPKRPGTRTLRSTCAAGHRRRPSPSAIAVGHCRRDSSTRPIDAALRADAHFALTGNWPIRYQPGWECESENGRGARLPWSMQHARANRASRSHSPASACADGWSDASARSTRARLGCNMAQHGAKHQSASNLATAPRRDAIQPVVCACHRPGGVGGGGGGGGRLVAQHALMQRRVRLKQTTQC